MKRISAVLAAVVLFGSLASAQTINQRQWHQQKRIAQGVQSGSLTVHEARQLEKKQYGLAKFEAKQRNDGGVFTAKERAQVQHRQNQLSKKIYRQKHDNQRR